MTQNDFHFIERQGLRINTMAQLEENGPERIALEFKEFMGRGGLVPKIDEALVGPDKHIETYFYQWCFLVSLPPRLVDSVWEAVLGKDGEDGEDA